MFMVMALPLTGIISGGVGSSGTAQAGASTGASSVIGTIDRSGTSTASTAAAVRVSAASPATGSSTTETSSASSKSTVEAASAQPRNPRSINAWVSCSGTSDDTSGVMKAFAAAKNNAFTLIVDCPVKLHSGLAIDRGIFIDNGTTVEFTGSGKFVVDNLFHPAFIIANSSNITLTNWNVEWQGSVPVNPNFGGYEWNGRFVSSGGDTQPAGAFNDLVLTPWLASNRAITFSEGQGYVKSYWVGGVNPAAVFFLTGDTSNVVFSGLKLYVPANAAGGHNFMPLAFSSSPNWKSRQTVTGRTPLTARYAAVPHQLTFSGLDLDGTLMGWQGNLQDAMFENITSHRYGDLQDANGGNVGGIGKWFPPPHLFYLNTHATDPALFNTNVHFSNIVDLGIRSGVARDRPGDSGSGYANSLKLSCVDCTVDGYTSHRPDGFMDVLDSTNLTVSNVTATFDSLFIYNLYPAGVRFPDVIYQHITFEGVQMTDTADATSHGPIGNATNNSNDDIVFSNVQVNMSKWTGPANELPLPTIGGSNNNIALNFTMTSQSMKVAHLQKAAMSVTVKGTPATLRPGATTQLTWTSREAGSCGTSGAWSGSIATNGSRSVKVGSAGAYDFGLNCRNSSVSSGTSVVVVAAD
jgi:hypothetical protein